MYLPSKSLAHKVGEEGIVEISGRREKSVGRIRRVERTDVGRKVEHLERDRDVWCNKGILYSTLVETNSVAVQTVGGRST